MVIYANTEYNPGDRVLCRFQVLKDVRAEDGISEGRVSDIRVVHHEHSRQDAHMIYYLVEPAELVGFEHDDYEAIYEGDILGPVPG